MNTIKNQPSLLIYLGISAIVPCLLITGCGSLPSAGPSTSKILSRGKAENRSAKGKFTLIPVTESVVEAANNSEAPCTGITTKDLENPKLALGSPANQKISIGDVVNVTIYTTGGGLFGGGAAMTSAGIPGMGSAGKEGGVSMGTSVPSQVVDDTEAITVPYVGRIQVAGKAPNEVEKEIADRMKGMAFTPYAVVTVGGRMGSDLVTVTGDVKTPHRISVPLPGLRIADALTEAGGSSGKDYETVVTLIRGVSVRSSYLSEILRNPTSNIYLKPGDTLVVRTRPWSYVTLGATGQNLRPFLAGRMTVAEALGSSNGMEDNRANPEAVFLYRLESPTLLNRIGGFYHGGNAEGVPVIYHFNLRDPKGFFMAKQFAMRDKDILYVGNAGVLGFQKAVNVIGTITSPVMTTASAAGGVTAISTVRP
jgi:polysaccharide biosynthesis/export protein